MQSSSFLPRPATRQEQRRSPPSPHAQSILLVSACGRETSLILLSNFELQPNRVAVFTFVLFNISTAASIIAVRAIEFLDRSDVIRLYSQPLDPLLNRHSWITIVPGPP